MASYLKIIQISQSNYYPWLVRLARHEVSCFSFPKSSRCPLLFTSTFCTGLFTPANLPSYSQICHDWKELLWYEVIGSCVVLRTLSQPAYHIQWWSQYDESLLPHTIYLCFFFPRHSFSLEHFCWTKSVQWSTTLFWRTPSHREECCYQTSNKQARLRWVNTDQVYS